MDGGQNPPVLGPTNNGKLRLFIRRVQGNSVSVVCVCACGGGGWKIRAFFRHAVNRGVVAGRAWPDCFNERVFLFFRLENFNMVLKKDIKFFEFFVKL